MNDIIIHTNKYQTPITKTLVDSLSPETAQEFMDVVENVPLIKYLISPSRKYARDLPRDEEGKIIVDLEHPHILEDMDYFRQAVLYYKKTGKYTPYRRNSNPTSEYMKFWAEEIRRCRDGLVRPYDGEWVTGYMYWFMNYTPMAVNIIVKGTKRADRVTDFPFTFEGIYWRFHYIQKAHDEGKHAIELAKRGAAKSYSFSGIMTHNLLLGQDSKVTENVKTVLTAYQTEYLKDDKDGTLSKFRPALGFLKTNTEFPRLLLKESASDMTWIAGYKDKKTKADKGTFNQVIGVSAKDNPDKLRGKRGWILFEEMGAFKGLLELYNSTRRNVEDGGYAFSTLYLVGTANSKDSDFSSARTLLYHPDSYNIKYINNVYDKPGKGRDIFGFFFPAYINRAGCYDYNGNSDVVKALLEIFEAREIARKSNDIKTILRVVAEDPITPEEAMVQAKTAYFPTAALSERLSQLDNDPTILDNVHIGVLSEDARGNVKFTPTNDVPIRDWGNSDENDIPGALEIYVMPETNANGEVPYNRYILGHDPVDNDQAVSSSLSSTFVLDTITDQIVAEYTGRNPLAVTNYEAVRLLCKFYNGTCLYESNKKGLFSYFQTRNCTSLLADTPEYLREKQLVKYSGFGSGAKGVNASAAINALADKMISDWLQKPVTTTIIEDGVEKDITIMNLYHLKSRAFIKELMGYNPQVNVDRIRAVGMLMLYREVFMIRYQGNMANRVEYKPNTFSTSSFFNENYDDYLV